MRYRIFGRCTGLRVSELALGAGNFGTRWGHGAERAEAKKIFDSYVDAGGNFIDTADSDQFGESEEIVGAAERDYFVLATKMNEVFSLERAAEAYEHMMSGKARFRAVLTTGR